MCKRKLHEVCSTLTFLLGGGFGVAVCYFHDHVPLKLHPVLLIVLAGITFYVTQIGKSTLGKKF